MSLLIKALQKAEEKKTADSGIGTSAGELSLEPKASHSGQENQGASDSYEPALSSHAKPAQQAAASVFSAKLSQPNNAGSKKLLLIAAVSLLLALLVGMQVFSYIDSLSQPVLPMPRSHIEPQPQTQPQPLAQAQQVLTEADGAANTPTAQEKASPVADETTVKPRREEALAGEAPTQPEPASTKFAGAKAETARPPRSEEIVMGKPVAKPEDDAVKITRNPIMVGVNPDLDAAYKAYMADEFAMAQSHYRRVLQSDMHNVDALLGMAAIALQQGRNQDAAGWYGQVLEVDPRNTIAQAALVSGLAQADPVGAESRIKNLLVQKPDAAHLHAALGNIYAQRSEWAQAQQAYFQAFHFAPGNADYAFNLAVSLDHLGKSSLALQYYRQAQALLSTSGSANINRAQLESRILQLQ